MEQLRPVREVVEYLKENELRLVTAESCTAGKIIELLAEVPGSGSALETGYVVYSVEAKRRVLNVNQYTIDTFNLTSVEVAIEMARGALSASEATVAVACTGLAGPEGVDGIQPGTICFAWGFRRDTESDQDMAVFGRTVRFPGNRSEVIDRAARLALDRIPGFHRQFRRGERA